MKAITKSVLHSSFARLRAVVLSRGHEILLALFLSFWRLTRYYDVERSLAIAFHCLLTHSNSFVQVNLFA